MTIMNMVQAINSALQQEMQHDKTVLLLGEDVGRNGGVFRVTEGLWQKFGDERVIDTPLAESAIAGVSIGLAVNGFKPVAEIQFDGFSIPTLDQLINHAGRIRTRSRGRFNVPMVLRVPYGGGIRALEHHSDSPETYFIHAPGLKVVCPATPYDAKGLLISAIRDPDPVIFLEPKRIYRAIKEEVPDEAYEIKIGEAQVVQEGTDVTVVSYGAMLRVCKEAAEKVADNTSVELINLRSLKPFDAEAIAESVKKTGRVVVVNEAPKMMGFAAEIIATINEKTFLYLRAPPVRVTGFDTIVPLPKMEKYYFPDAARVVKAIDSVMEFE
ncbi:MAG TPA: alpha-ketoacid dehydrogenase subunit beta [archaeon]|nr:alpha-ketoacid dehydrogenase subunit beta [archaeon]